MRKFVQLTPARKAKLLTGVVLLLVYFSLGVMFLSVGNLPFDMSPAMKTGFGVILIAYSVFRFVRYIKELKTQTEEDHT